MKPVSLIKKNHNVKSTIAIVFGIIGIFSSLIPVFGFPMNMIGLILAILGLKSEKQGRARTGIMLSSVGLVLTITSTVVGAIAVYSMKT